VIELKCKNCHKWRPEDAFARDVTMVSGRRSMCSTCRAAAKREIRAKNSSVNARAREKNRTTEAHREQVARDLCAAVQMYWHVGVNNNLVGWTL
jgi:hypothetical protein